MSEAALAIKVFFANSVSSPAQNLFTVGRGWRDEQLPDGTVIWTVTGAVPFLTNRKCDMIIRNEIMLARRRASAT